MRRAAALGSGFLYGISRLGVTGARDRVADGARGAGRGGSARETTLPVALGFGISRPEHVARGRRSGPTRRWSAARSSSVIAEARRRRRDLAATRSKRYVRWLRS